MQYFVSRHGQNRPRADPGLFLWWVAMDNRLGAERRATALTYIRTVFAYRRARHALRGMAALLEPGGTRTRWAGTAPSLPGLVSWLELYQ